MEEKVYSVSEVNKYIKMLFEKNTFFSNISIKGEVTNFKAHYSGHLYFTLKDETSTLKCIMFKGYADYLKFKLEDGMKVVITGQISIYEAGGSYQVYCKQIEPQGLGALYLAYEQLKAKLEKEGIFDPSHKNKIPYLPKKVGIITSKTGAVVQDIINVTTRRFDKVDLLIYPAQVQGANVANTVIQGIKTFHERGDVDVIIIARGGGSFEDLFGFNDESLARVIYESTIPIISAVGHETDFTICDFAADLRAPTPSAAAEMVYPQRKDLYQFIHNFRLRSNHAIMNYLMIKKQYVKTLKASKIEKIPLDYITQYRIKIDRLLSTNEYKTTQLLEQKKSSYLQYVSKLDGMSPLKTLQRGYSVVTDKNHHVISKKNDVNKEDELTIQVSDGTIAVKVMN